MNGKKSPKIRLTTRENRKGAIFTQKIDWKFFNIIIVLSPSSTFSTSYSYPSAPPRLHRHPLLCYHARRHSDLKSLPHPDLKKPRFETQTDLEL
jgi:hypothetical protein